MKGESYGNYILLFYNRNRYINRFDYFINLCYCKERMN